MAMLEEQQLEQRTERTPGFGILRQVAASALAAVLAGVVAGGFGGRLVMRIATLLDPARIGVRTENGNRIGSITTDGTLALVLFGGLFAGIMAAVIWVVIRPWLPRRGLRAYSVAAIAAVGLLGFTVVEAANRDFLILEPAVANVVMFGVVIAVAGLLTKWLDGRLVARLSDASWFTPVAILLFAFGCLLAPAALAAFVSSDFCACAVPPRPAGVALLVVGAATATTWALRWRGVELPGALRLAGVGATTAAIAFGALHLIGQVAAIV